jgi:hypothetical protein
MATPLPPKTLVNRPLVDRCRPLAAVVLLLASAASCSSRSKDIAAAKRDVEKDMDGRAAAAASAAVKSAMDDQEKQREERARREADAKRAERDAVMKRPEAFLAATNVQTSKKAANTIALASLSITNTSKYPMTDVRGTLELHGGDMADAGMSTDVIASVPIELSGSIAPGASMSFTAEQHTVSGGSVQVKNPVDRVTFTVTGVRSVGPGAGEDDATKDGGL